MAKKDYKFVFGALLIILGIFLVLNLSLIFPQYFQKTDNSQPAVNYTRFLSNENGVFVSMNLAAVDSNNNGVTTPLNVEATEGTGRTLVDIENLLFWGDTQQSIRLARQVAGNITGKNLDNYDLIYNIKANATIIGGPSAGAALTIATIAALENKAPNPNVMITGTINHDGTIGPVGGILEKAQASAQEGATLFLVPLGQSNDVVYETSQHCEKYGGLDLCTTETIPKKVNIKNETGINVAEVSNIQDAEKYFFS